MLVPSAMNRTKMQIACEGHEVSNTFISHKSVGCDCIRRVEKQESQPGISGLSLSEIQMNFIWFVQTIGLDATI